MMDSDLQNTKDFLDELGVTYHIRPAINGVSLQVDDTCIKFNGYLGFFVAFGFNKDGKFLNMGAFE